MNGEVDPRRKQIREIVSTLPTIVQEEQKYPTGVYFPPEQWPRGTVNLLSRIRPQISEIEDEGVVKDARKVLLDSIRYIRENSRVEDRLNEERIAFAMKSSIAGISHQLAEPTAFKDYDHYKHRVLTYEEMKERYPERFDINYCEVDGIPMRSVGILNNNNVLLGTNYVPLDPYIRLKGSDPRVVGKRAFRDSDDLLSTEFPPSDLDLMILGNQHSSYETAIKMGASPDGIEFIREDLPWGEYCAGRDIEPNQCYLDSEGLHYSDEARISFETGVFSVIGKPVSGKSLYGPDTFPLTIDGEEIYLLKPRAGARIMKFVGEGKMKGANFREENGKHFDFRLYALFLVNKWQSKKEFPLYSQRLYHILEQMGQIEKSGRRDKNIMQLLESAHKKYPFFQFNRNLITPADVVEWLLRKLGKQIDRNMAQRHSLSSGFEIETTREALEKEILISLDGFRYDEKQGNEFLQWFPDFVRNCDEVVRKLPPQTNMQRMFFSGSMDGDDFDTDEIVFARVKNN